jgi:predicted dehydrogenase
MTSGPRVLVIGCGWIARQVHLPYLAAQRQAGMIGALYVSDTDPLRAVAACADFGAQPHEGRLTETPADVVLIATPPATHVCLTVGALTSGAHVITEKPLALTATGVDLILAASARYGRGVYPLYTNRHRAEMKVIRRAVNRHVGGVLDVQASWLRRSGVPGTEGGTEAGVLWDLGSHLTDLAVHLARWDVVSGTASGRHLHPAQGGASPGRARWQPSAGAAAHKPRDWYGVNVEALLTCAQAPSRRLSVRASWQAPVASDQAHIVLTGERGVLVWDTVLGWSPDRQTVAGPAVWIAGPGGAPAPVLQKFQCRDPRAEYTAQLDAAFAALGRYGSDPQLCAAVLRTACITTAILGAAQASLDTGVPHVFEAAAAIPAAKE